MDCKPETTPNARGFSAPSETLPVLRAQECVILDCGELAPGVDDGVSADDSGDNYAAFPDDATDVDFKDVSCALSLSFQTCPSFIPVHKKETLDAFLLLQKEKVVEISLVIKQAGNKFFKEQQFTKAKKKYDKSLR